MLPPELKAMETKVTQILDRYNCYDPMLKYDIMSMMVQSNLDATVDALERTKARLHSMVA